MTHNVSDKCLYEEVYFYAKIQFLFAEEVKNMQILGNNDNEFWLIFGILAPLHFFDLVRKHSFSGEPVLMGRKIGCTNNPNSFGIFL